MNLWVLLLALPFPLGCRPMLKGIGNTIGCFVAIEEDFMNAYDKQLEKILVEMDITAGLPTEVDILCHERIFS